MGETGKTSEPGHFLVQMSWWSTAALVAVLGLGVVATDALGPAVTAVSMVMFFAGTAAMALAFLAGVRRSRREYVSVPGLFLLQGSAPRSIQRSMLGSFIVQCAAAVTAASLRPFTLLAFGILAPALALGLMGLRGARYGEFEDRADPSA